MAFLCTRWCVSRVRDYFALVWQWSVLAPPIAPRIASSADSVMSASLSMSVALLSFCDVLRFVFALIDTFRGSYSSSDSCHSWVEVLVAWLCTSAWHSAGEIGLLFIDCQEESVCPFLSSAGSGCPCSESCTIVSSMLCTVHHKRESSKISQFVRARTEAPELAELPNPVRPWRLAPRDAI